MRHHQIVEQNIQYHKAKNQARGKTLKLAWWQLTIIGIGSIIGAGFFLGTGLSISLAGPAILLCYLLGGVTALLAFNALAEMSVNDPDPGSFRAYARKAFGPGLGFVSGWMYWLAGVFIMSSEISALAIFSRFWFPHLPLWIFSIIFASLGFLINFLGVGNFGKVESFFGFLKITTLVSFILFGLLVLTGVITPEQTLAAHAFPALTGGAWFPHGFQGAWSAMLFVMFSYGGIAVVGITSNELENKREISKAGNLLIVILSTLYILSLFFVLNITSWKGISASESPFVTALSSFQLPYISSIFNVILISAAFSTMVGALFSITKILVSLAEDQDAPAFLAKKNARGVTANALCLNAFGLAFAVLLSYLLPNTVYELITTAAGIMLILNWIIIFASQLKNRRVYEQAKTKPGFLMWGYPYTSYLGILLIIFSISGALFGKERTGFFLSFGFLLLIGLSYFISSKLKKSSA